MVSIGPFKGLLRLGGSPAGWGLRPGLPGFPCRGLGFAGLSLLSGPWLGALGGLVGGSAWLGSGRFTSCATCSVFFHLH